VARCSKCNLERRGVQSIYRIDHGEPLGLLHERAYIPMDSWRALVALVAQDLSLLSHLLA
jgi:hypothetical protein